MDGSHELERRNFAEAPGLEVKADENGRTVIRGYAAVFESESQDLGGFVEVVERGAFDEVMKASPDVFGRFNHDRLLGRTTSGTMRLFVDERGLRYEIDPPRAAADVVELIERGDVRGSSFAFRVKGDGEKWYKDQKGRTIRSIKRFSSLHDAGPVEQPAYLSTETYVSKRALEMAQHELAEVPGEQRENPVVDEAPAEPAVAAAEERAEVNLRPTAGMAAAAKSGLRLHEEGKSGDGLKPETVARANKIARREALTEDHVREMNAWFARHEEASKSPDWNKPGAEKPGWVAWQLWGGTAAKNWSARKVREMDGERDLEAYDEEADFDPIVVEEPRSVVVSVETTDFLAKIAALKVELLRTPLHGK